MTRSRTARLQGPAPDENEPGGCVGSVETAECFQDQHGVLAVGELVTARITFPPGFLAKNSAPEVAGLQRKESLLIGPPVAVDRIESRRNPVLGDPEANQFPCA